jgi:uncharacterized membrane protein YkvA (DUF1232 family)
MSKVRNAGVLRVLDYRSEQSLAVPMGLFILAIIYLISPVDLIPDVPVIGHIDDLFITAIATLNLFQKWLRSTSMILSSMLGLLKWLVIFAGIGAVSLGGMALWGIAKIFMG